MEDKLKADPMDEAKTPEARKILKLQQKLAAKKNEQKQKHLSKQSLRKMKTDNLDESEPDPYLSLGFGLIAYRSTLWSLTLLFIVLSLIAYPLIKTYENGGAIDTEIIETKFGIFSIANLGYSSVQCATIPFN